MIRISKQGHDHDQGAEEHNADAVVHTEQLTDCFWPANTHPLAEKPMYIRHTATIGNVIAP